MNHRHQEVCLAIDQKDVGLHIVWSDGEDCRVHSEENNLESAAQFR
jgi:hypothetical protein